MKRRDLIGAKKRRDDEYYTRLQDIENMASKVLKYSPDMFKGRRVLLPCDDPNYSKFVEFFANNYDSLGLKGLVASSFNEDGRGKKWDYSTGEETLLDGDGDFRSEEVTKLRNRADLISTNPPFSQIGDFANWVDEKECVYLAPLLSITYKNIFPLFQDSKIHVLDRHLKVRFFDRPDGSIKELAFALWFTSLTIPPSPLPELKPKDSLLTDGTKMLRDRGSWWGYENYPVAIDAPSFKDIPSDYDGVIGVPITYMMVHDPDKYEIVGLKKGTDGKDVSFKENGKRAFVRVFIRKRR